MVCYKIFILVNSVSSYKILFCKAFIARKTLNLKLLGFKSIKYLISKLSNFETRLSSRKLTHKYFHKQFNIQAALMA